MARFSLKQLFACVTLSAASIALAVAAFTRHEELREPPGAMRLLTLIASAACLVGAAWILKKGATRVTVAWLIAMIGLLILLRIRFRN